MSKSSRNDATEVPGAKTCFDDSVAVHINQTLFIHSTASFLSWHRFFTWTYKQALRKQSVSTGPFAGMTVNMRPNSRTLAEPEVDPATSSHAY